MGAINIHEAKTHLSRLVDEAAAGREIVIAKAGKPMAKLTPLAGARPQRKLGTLKGRLKVQGNFDAPLPAHIIEDFEA